MSEYGKLHIEKINDIEKENKRLNLRINFLEGYAERMRLYKCKLEVDNRDLIMEKIKFQNDATFWKISSVLCYVSVISQFVLILWLSS